MPTPKPIWWLLDNSQGGFIDDFYQSPGKHSPILPDGRTLYEGEFSRDIVNRIAKKCLDYHIPHRKLVPEPNDIPAHQRVRRANQFSKLHNPCLVLSIRLNKTQREAHHSFRKLKGISAYYRSATGSRLKIWSEDHKSSSEKTAARVFLHYLHAFSGFHKRGIKRTSQSIMSGLEMPLLMTRSGFIDNLESCKSLLDPTVREKLAQGHFEAIRSIQQLGLNNLARIDFSHSNLRLVSS